MRLESEDEAYAPRVSSLDVMNVALFALREAFEFEGVVDPKTGVCGWESGFAGGSGRPRVCD